jgi:phospholipid transport system substrate-binding protein
MRKIELIVTALAAAGLIFAVVAEAAQKKMTIYAPAPPASGEIDVSARQAKKEWQAASLGDEARLALATPVETAAAGEQNFDRIFKRLSRMETAGGPDSVNPIAAAKAVQKMGNDAMAIVNDGALAPELKQAKFQQLMARDFDLPLIARFALGRHWRTLSNTDKKAYVDAFSRFVLKTYAGQLMNAKIKAFEVVSNQLAGKRDIMVQTRIVRGGGRILNLVWRLRSRNGAYRVIDVVAEGISLALTKRQEFAAIIRANGGQVSPLINSLRSRA